MVLVFNRSGLRYEPPQADEPTVSAIKLGATAQTVPRMMVNTVFTPMRLQWPTTCHHVKTTKYLSCSPPADSYELQQLGGPRANLGYVRVLFATRGFK